MSESAGIRLPYPEWFFHIPVDRSWHTDIERQLKLWGVEDHINFLVSRFQEGDVDVSIELVNGAAVRISRDRKEWPLVIPFEQRRQLYEVSVDDTLIQQYVRDLVDTTTGMSGEVGKRLHDNIEYHSWDQVKRQVSTISVTMAPSFSLLTSNISRVMFDEFVDVIDINGDDMDASALIGFIHPPIYMTTIVGPRVADPWATYSVVRPAGVSEVWFHVTREIERYLNGSLDMGMMEVTRDVI